MPLPTYEWMHENCFERMRYCKGNRISSISKRKNCFSQEGRKEFGKISNHFCFYCIFKMKLLNGPPFTFRYLSYNTSMLSIELPLFLTTILITITGLKSQHTLLPSINSLWIQYVLCHHCYGNLKYNKWQWLVFRTSILLI